MLYFDSFSLFQKLLFQIFNENTRLKQNGSFISIYLLQNSCEQNELVNAEKNVKKSIKLILTKSQQRSNSIISINEFVHNR